MATRVHLDGRAGFGAGGLGVPLTRSGSPATAGHRRYRSRVVAAWDARRDALRHALRDLRRGGRTIGGTVGAVRRHSVTIPDGRIQHRCERRNRVDGMAPRAAGRAAHDGGGRCRRGCARRLSTRGNLGAADADVDLDISRRRDGDVRGEWADRLGGDVHGARARAFSRARRGGIRRLGTRGRCDGSAVRGAARGPVAAALARWSCSRERNGFRAGRSGLCSPGPG